MPENATIIEMRIYTAHVGKAAAFVALYREKGLPIQEPIQGGLLGMYRTEFGPMNQIILLWEYPDHAARDARRAALLEAPGWTDFLREAAPLIQSEESRLLLPA
ncbi:MAG: NIPSNAP family protein [Rhodospirillaceae bacterium]|nr:NIPSNAP family protein [Rhodospirillaceae bacterium]